MASVRFNNSVSLILADVDETIADVYCPAESDMIHELNQLLHDGKVLFLVTGGSLKRVMSGITDFLTPSLRQKVIVSHCSGAEVWGFQKNGNLNDEPFYSLYEEKLDSKQRANFRKVISELVDEFHLRTHPAMPKIEFVQKYGTHPLEVMLDDRGPQITIECRNGSRMSDEQLALLDIHVPKTHDEHDLRIPLFERAEQLIAEYDVPVTPRLAGTMALDFAIKGVSKATSVEFILQNEDILKSYGLDSIKLRDPKSIEIWGDKFSVIRGGSDRHMCEAVDPKVRTIDFRQENPEEFMDGYNIVLWDGNEHLHHGTLEYLQSRTT